MVSNNTKGTFWRKHEVTREGHFFVMLAAATVACPSAYAQNVSDLPVCHVPLAGAFPLGPSVGVVVDSDYAYATAVAQA